MIQSQLLFLIYQCLSENKFKKNMTVGQKNSLNVLCGIIFQFSNVWFEPGFSHSDDMIPSNEGIDSIQNLIATKDFIN